MDPQTQNSEPEIPKRWTDYIGLFGAVGLLIVIFSGGCSIYFGYLLLPFLALMGGEGANLMMIIGMFSWGLLLIGFLLTYLDWRRS